MRVDGAVTYDVSQGHYVRIRRSDRAGDKVYFISEEQLTSDDLDSSIDLYLWSQAGEPYPGVARLQRRKPRRTGEQRRIATGDFLGLRGQNTTDCGVAPFDQWLFCAELRRQLPLRQLGGRRFGRHLLLLPGAAGRDARHPGPGELTSTGTAVKYVDLDHRQRTLLQGLSGSTMCSRMLRMQVPPDGSTWRSHPSSINQYDNGGHKEIYRYNPAPQTRLRLLQAGGETADLDVKPSQNGLFMTDDGRVVLQYGRLPGPRRHQRGSTSTSTSMADRS